MGTKFRVLKFAQLFIHRSEMSRFFYNHEKHEIKALLTRREGNHGARVTLARGLPQHLHISCFLYMTCL